VGKINLYVSDSDEPLLAKLRSVLEKEGKSMSEFVVDAAKDYLASEAKPGTIELQGLGAKKVFQGNELYWNADSNSEKGVFLTAKGAIAYWSCVPRAINPGEREIFQVYGDLDQLFEEQDWLNKNRNSHIKTAIQQEYVALTNRRLVEELDI
jgi:hypothetical protein